MEMYDFTNKWYAERERILKDIKYSKLDVYEHIKRRNDLMWEKAQTVADVFGLLHEDVLALIPSNSYILRCEEDELKRKVSFFKNIFKNDLLEVINCDHILMPIHYGGFFAYKDENNLDFQG